MSASDGDIGFGTLFKVRTSTGPDVYTTIGQQTKVKPYSMKTDSIDVSHEQSPGATREFVPGLNDAGEAEIGILYKLGGAAEVLLLSLRRTKQVCRTVAADGAYAQYTAFITEIDPDMPMDDKMTAAVKFKISGDIAINAASAPTNSLLPSIAGSDGTPNVGDTLTALHGIWANEPTSYTYQWKKDGSAISGATAQTYLVVSGDATHAITVTVTATNSAGSASATSIATPAIGA